MFACKVKGIMTISVMERMSKLKMKYRYRGEWREKYVSLETVWQWVRDGKYRKRVEVVRGMGDITTPLVPLKDESGSRYMVRGVSADSIRLLP